MPRRHAARARTSVAVRGIAGVQTVCIRPRRPGGWQLIGRTAGGAVRSPRGPIPFLMQPGDAVQFLPDRPEEFDACTT